jgi:hypothetical protein
MKAKTPEWMIKELREWLGVRKVKKTNSKIKTLKSLI